MTTETETTTKKSLEEKFMHFYEIAAGPNFETLKEKGLAGKLNSCENYKTALLALCAPIIEGANIRAQHPEVFGHVIVHPNALEAISLIGEYFLAAEDSQIKKDVPKQIIGDLIAAYDFEPVLNNPEEHLE